MLGAVSVVGAEPSAAGAAQRRKRGEALQDPFWVSTIAHLRVARDPRGPGPLAPFFVAFSPHDRIGDSHDAAAFPLTAPPRFEAQPKELGIEVSDHTVTVTGTGTRSESQDETGKAFRLRERLEREFARRFELPVGADTAHVEAAFGKGVLTVRTPRARAAAPHKVEISKRRSSLGLNRPNGPSGAAAHRHRCGRPGRMDSDS